MGQVWEAGGWCCYFLFHGGAPHRTRCAGGPGLCFPPHGRAGVPLSTACLGVSDEAAGLPEAGGCGRSLPGQGALGPRGEGGEAGRQAGAGL